MWPEPVRLVSWMRCMPSTCFSTWAGRASRDPDACLRFRSAVSPPPGGSSALAAGPAGGRALSSQAVLGLRGPRAGLPASAAPAGTFHFRASIRSLAAHAVAASRARRFTTKRVSGSVSPRRVPGILGNLHLSAEYHVIFTPILGGRFYFKITLVLCMGKMRRTRSRTWREVTWLVRQGLQPAPRLDDSLGGPTERSVRPCRWLRRVAEEGCGAQSAKGRGACVESGGPRRSVPGPLPLGSPGHA